MNIQSNNENGTIRFQVTVGEADYKGAVDKTLRNYRQKANIPGFRPGMVPMGIVNKMYRKGVVAEESYRMAAKACVDSLNESKTRTLGELLPAEEQAELDFEHGVEFEYAFEIGRAPEIDIELSKKDKVTKYVIAVSDEMLTGYKENHLRRFGKLEDVETVKKDEALTVVLDQPEMRIEEAYVGLIGMSDAERAPFIGKKVGDKMEVNVNELYKTPSQRASILGVKEEELAGIDPRFSLEITRIREFVLPGMDAEFFAQAFPDGDIKNEKEFDKYAIEQISKDMARETAFKFLADFRDFLVAKADLSLPDDFLKRWLHTANEGKFTMEQIESEYASFAKVMAWDLIERYYIDKLALEVSPEEARQEAQAVAAMQFAYYGMPSVGGEMLENYAKQILSNQEEAKKIYDKLYEQKIIDTVAPEVTITEKKVTVDEFNKLFEK
jgi:trigger factor